MQELTLKIIYMILYLTAAIGRVPFAKKVKKIKVLISIKKTKEKFLTLLGLPLMVLPLIYIFSDWIAFFNMINPNLSIRIIGAVGFAFAVFLHNWSHIALGTNWSPMVEIRKNQKLITSGPYKYVRHPMYSAFLLWSIFQGLFLANWLILIGGLASFLILYFLRINDEEELMQKQFKQAYKTYKKNTGKLFPKIR